MLLIQSHSVKNLESIPNTSSETIPEIVEIIANALNSLLLVPTEYLPLKKKKRSRNSIPMFTL